MHGWTRPCHVSYPACFLPFSAWPLALYSLSAAVDKGEGASVNEYATEFEFTLDHLRRYDPTCLSEFMQIQLLGHGGDIPMDCAEEKETHQIRFGIKYR